MEVNMISWFEVPVLDMDRAKKFYETVFNVEISIQDFGGVLMKRSARLDSISARCVI